MPGASPDQNPDSAHAGASSDVVQFGFWLCVIAAAASAGMVLAWPGVVGIAGPILLTGIATMAGIMLFWQGAAIRQKQTSNASSDLQESNEQMWLDALGEMALITDSTGLVEVASESYRAVVSDKITLGDGGLPPTPDGRLFGSDADATAAIYRLNRAAQQGARHGEIFVTDTDAPLSGRMEVLVSPLGRKRTLWRLCPAGDDRAARSERHISDLYVDDAPIGFFAMQADGKILYANPALRESLPVPGDIVGQGAKNVLLPASVVGKLLRSRQGSGRTRMDLTLKGRDGNDLPVTLYTSWVGKGAEAVSRSIMVPGVGDQGDSQMISQSEVGIDISRVPFGAVELDGQPPGEAMIIASNPELQRMAGPAAEPGGKFADLFETPRELEKAEGSGPVELTLAGADAVTVDVYPESWGSQDWPVAWLIDVSQRKTMQMQMERGQKMQAMGRLVGGVAHDFNNLLLGMILNVDKLLIRHPVGDPSFMDLQRIKEFASRGAELVRTLLAYSRRQTFRREVVEISDVLSDYFTLLRQIIDERIKVDIEHGRDLPRVEIDTGQIETALTNLATNARDAMLESHGGGQLTIRTSVGSAETARRDGVTHVPDGSYLVIDISDTGPGLDSRTREEMFQPFFTTKENGNGLGLATVYGIVKQSEGYIYVLSEPGKGARFRIFLPATDRTPDSRTDRADGNGVRNSGPDDLAGRGTILLVEDEDAVRGVAAELLGSLGYRVEQAASGEQALEMVKAATDPVDLIISDVVLPEMDGPALLRAVRPLIGDTPVMFISGYAERELTEALDSDEAVSFLPKPFTLRQLAERVKARLDDAKAA